MIVLLLRRADERFSMNRWRRLGFVGALLIGVGSTGAGALPVTDQLGQWPTLPWTGTRPWVPEMIVYVGLTVMVGSWWRLGSMLRRAW